MSFVLDSSVALAMLLPDEQSAATDSLAERLAPSPAFAPSIWPLEVRNALLAALRSRRITGREFDERVAVLEALPIEVEVAADRERLARTVAFARLYDLSSYDAAYLELAKDRGVALATLDSRLRVACGKAKIAILP